MPTTRGVRPFVLFALCLAMLGSSLAPALRASAAANDTPAEMLASLDGLDSAYARRYGVPSDWITGIGTPAPTATPPSADRSVTRATITILQFATEQDAGRAWELTSGSLVAGAIIRQRPPDLAATTIADLGGSATMYLLSDDVPTNGGLGAAGILFVRLGTTGIIVEGEGAATNAELGDRLQAFALFVLDHEPTTPEVTVIAKGEATGGAFDRMPGPDDPGILRGLVPMWDYDLMVNDSPIVGPNATPVAPCGCTTDETS